MEIWSIEKDDRCPSCGGADIALITPYSWTDTNDEPVDDTAEVSAHYCRTCERLVGVMLCVKRDAPLVARPEVVTTVDRLLEERRGLWEGLKKEGD